MDAEDIQKKNTEERLQKVQTEVKKDEETLKRILQKKKDKRKRICEPEKGIHFGPYQDFTEVCLNCGRNTYDYSPLENIMNAPLVNAKTAGKLITHILDKCKLLRTKESDILEREVLAYQAGWNGYLPSGWERYLDEVQKQTEKEALYKDPDYQQYLKLKKKFESK